MSKSSAVSETIHFERYFRIVFRKGAEIHIQTEIGFAGEAIVTDVMFIRLNKLPLQQMKF
jgi:hypothetical protein